MSKLISPNIARVGLRQLSIHPQRRTLTSSSKFGPKYVGSPHFMGMTLKQGVTLGTTLGMFGVSAGIFAFFFFAEVPKVRKDIVEKIPILGDYFHQEVAPEDQWF